MQLPTTAPCRSAAWTRATASIIATAAWPLVTSPKLITCLQGRVPLQTGKNGNGIHGDATGTVENALRRGKRAKNRRRKQKFVPTMDTIKEDAHENLNDQESEMLDQNDTEYQRGPAWSSGVAPGDVVAPRQGRPKNPTDQADVQGPRRAIYRAGAAPWQRRFCRSRR